MKQSDSITEMLRLWSSNDLEVSEVLLTSVYKELHKQASRFLRRERPNHTLQTTALIHEAYIKLIEQRGVQWESRTHFFAIAARIMRRILVDHARSKYREKRGGKNEDLPLDEAMYVVSSVESTDLIALDQALDRLDKIDGRLVRIVEFRYFSGLTLEETADVLKVSRTTVAKEWAMAKAWLLHELTR